MERELLIERDTDSSQNLKNVASVPRYVIDLDQPPETRWNQLADDYKGNRYKCAVRTIFESIKSLSKTLKTKLISNNIVKFK